MFNQAISLTAKNKKFRAIIVIWNVAQWIKKKILRGFVIPKHDVTIQINTFQTFYNLEVDRPLTSIIYSVQSIS